MDQQQIDTTLAITQAMVDELTDYLMGDSLYRQLMVKTAGGVRQPKMTLGALLENMQSLEDEQVRLSAEQRRQTAAMGERIAVARASFASQWDALLRRELKALLDSWRWYLDDAARDAAARERYPQEAHIRTRIELVQAELADDPLAAERRRELSQLDATLRPMLHGSGYVGPRGSENRYPAGRAWWLYGRPGNGASK
ncbi:MAG TPA: hypothetical protein PKM78_04450 [Anaerolineae bacterium]|nr:hypothetical protein [Anaerolineae bacterium]